MKFRLYYRGPLHANGGVNEKQRLRRAFHPQLRTLFGQEPLSGSFNHPISRAAFVCPPIGGFESVCLVTNGLHLFAELEILFLRPGQPGTIISAGGDIDNRLKTLFDGLRRPLNTGEIPNGDQPRPEEIPFYCVLSDDALITRVDVQTDQLLQPTQPDEVVLIIHVIVRSRQTTWDNIGLAA
jgi:hypothetical protein